MMQQVSEPSVLSFFTHAVKTPLFVSLCALEDMCEGVPLTEEECRDALHATQKMRYLIESLSMWHRCGQKDSHSSRDEMDLAPLRLQVQSHAEELEQWPLVTLMHFMELFLDSAFGDGEWTLASEKAGLLMCRRVSPSMPGVVKKTAIAEVCGNPLSALEMNLLMGEASLLSHGVRSFCGLASDGQVLQLSFAKKNVCDSKSGENAPSS